MNRLQLPKVSRKQPTLRISIVGYEHLAASEGETAIYLSRYGTNWEFLKYLALSTTDGYASFQLDELLFVEAGGIYTARFVYRGIDLGSINFEYVADKIELVARAS